MKAKKDPKEKPKLKLDTDRIDDALLALLYLNHYPTRVWSEGLSVFFFFWQTGYSPYCLYG